VGRFTGSVSLVAVGALSAAVYASAMPLSAWLGVEPLRLHLLVFGAAFALYLLALGLVVRGRAAGRGALGVILGSALVFRILLVWTPVYLSSDPYRYLWDGRVQWAGVSPYRYPPAAPELAMLRDLEVYPQINRPTAVTVYPPAAQWLFALAAAVTPGTLPGWRVLLLLADTVTVVLLLCLLGRLGVPAEVVLAYAWSPLVLFEGIQAGHMDLVMIPVMLLALIWRMDGSSGRAGLALGVAVLMKLYPAILLLAWWRKGDWRLPAAVVATVGLGYLPYAASVGLGALGFLPTYVSSSYEDFNLGLRALLTYPFGLSDPVVRGAAMTLLCTLLAAVLCWIARTSRHDAAGLWRATALAVGAYVVLVPTAMHPWYVLWVVPFLCFSPSPALFFFSAAVALSYTQYLVEPETLPWWAWLAEYAPFYTLLVWEWSTGRFGPATFTGQVVGPRAVGTGAPRATDVTAR
jgi:alpha-1,6-mannosyltransferase